jgi:putative hydrolase of the HAD superfamily
VNGPVSAVLWDADQVLQDNGDGWRAEYDAFGGVTDAFLEDVWRAELPLMVGGDFPAALGEVARRHGVDAPVETLLSRWRSIVPLDGSWQVVDRLRTAGVRCYLATNQQEYRRAHIAATLGYDDRVDGAYYSCDLGLAKPDPAFFRAILDDLRLGGDAVLFVDDRDDNVDGARAAGLRAERWDHHDGLDALHRLLARHDLPATDTAG